MTRRLSILCTFKLTCAFPHRSWLQLIRPEVYSHDRRSHPCSIDGGLTAANLLSCQAEESPERRGTSRANGQILASSTPLLSLSTAEEAVPSQCATKLRLFHNGMWGSGITLQSVSTSLTFGTVWGGRLRRLSDGTLHVLALCMCSTRYLVGREESRGAIERYVRHTFHSSHRCRRTFSRLLSPITEESKCHCICTILVRTVSKVNKSSGGTYTSPRCNGLHPKH